jgi:flagellar basal body rod protein FlgC
MIDFLESKIMNMSPNEQIKWQRQEEKFRRARFNYYRRTDVFDRGSSQDDSQNNDHYNPNDNTANSHGYENIVVPVRDISSICNQVVRNIRKNNTDVVVLTTYRNLNHTVCSLSDIDPSESYKYICQDGKQLIVYQNVCLSFLF